MGSPGAGRSLTERWARPPARGGRRRRRRRGRLARPRRISPPSRAQEPPPLPPPRGLLMSRRCRGTAGAARHSPMAAASSVPAGRAAAAPEPPHQRDRVGTRPRAVPGAPGSREVHRRGRCQATSSGPAASTPGGVPGPAPAYRSLAAPPSLRLRPLRGEDGSRSASPSPRPAHLPGPAAPPRGRRGYSGVLSRRGRSGRIFLLLKR